MVSQSSFDKLRMILRPAQKKCPIRGIQSQAALCRTIQPTYEVSHLMTQCNACLPVYRNPSDFGNGHLVRSSSQAEPVRSLARTAFSF